MVDRVAGDPDDRPPFDPDGCGLWGKVYLEDEAGVNIVDGDPTLDGSGTGSLSLLSMDGPDTPVTHSFLIEDVDVLDQSFFCITDEDLAGVNEGFLFITFLDTFSYFEEEQYVQYRSIISDPVVPTLYYLSVWNPSTDYTTETDMWWSTSTGNRFDVPLRVRASRYEGSVDLQGFSHLPDRRARLCMYALGAREDMDLPFEVVGTTHVDPTALQVSGGATIDFSLNVAIRPEQVLKVFVYYVENRDAFDAFEGATCGTSLSQRSCDMKCALLEGPEGTVITESDPFVLEPVTGTCDMDETTPCL